MDVRELRAQTRQSGQHLIDIRLSPVNLLTALSQAGPIHRQTIRLMHQAIKLAWLDAEHFFIEGAMDAGQLHGDWLSYRLRGQRHADSVARRRARGFMGTSQIPRLREQ